MNLKFHLFTDILAALSATLALAAWQEQIDWALRIAASIVAIVAGSMAIYRYVKRKGPVNID